MIFNSILIIFICLMICFKTFCYKQIPGYVLKCHKHLQTGHIKEDESCELIAIKREVVINKYKTIIKSPPKPFASVYTQCVLCTTIAQEFHIKMYLLHASYPPRIMLNKKKINTTTVTFCNNAFENFDLQDYNQMRILLKPSPTTKHVTSYLDGMWANKLKEMCHMYISAYGPWFLYEKWFQESQNPEFQMTSVLCRSEGLFRHCYNINEDLTAVSITNKFPFIDTYTGTFTG